jgi:hypothetical protein
MSAPVLLPVVAEEPAEHHKDLASRANGQTLQKAPRHNLEAIFDKLPIETLITMEEFKSRNGRARFLWAHEREDDGSVVDNE